MPFNYTNKKIINTCKQPWKSSTLMSWFQFQIVSARVKTASNNINFASNFIPISNAISQSTPIASSLKHQMTIIHLIDASSEEQLLHAAHNIKNTHIAQLSCILTFLLDLIDSAIQLKSSLPRQNFAYTIKFSLFLH